MAKKSDVASAQRAAEHAAWQRLRPSGATTHSVGNRYAEFVEKMPRWEALLERIERQRGDCEVDSLLQLIVGHLGAPSPLVGQIMDLLGPHDLCVFKASSTGYLVLRPAHLRALRAYMADEGRTPLETILPTIYHPWG